MINRPEELDSALNYYSSEECARKYSSLGILTDDSFVISSIPNEATGHVGPVQLMSSTKTLQFIDRIKSKIPRRTIKF